MPLSALRMQFSNLLWNASVLSKSWICQRLPNHPKTHCHSSVPRVITKQMSAWLFIFYMSTNPTNLIKIHLVHSEFSGYQWGPLNVFLNKGNTWHSNGTQAKQITEWKFTFLFVFLVQDNVFTTWHASVHPSCHTEEIAINTLHTISSVFLHLHMLCVCFTRKQQ